MNTVQMHAYNYQQLLHQQAEIIHQYASVIAQQNLLLSNAQNSCAQMCEKIFRANPECCTFPMRSTHQHNNYSKSLPLHEAHPKPIEAKESTEKWLNPNA